MSPMIQVIKSKKKLTGKDQRIFDSKLSNTFIHVSGDKSVQCGRKVDAFQVWFMLKTRGERYFCEGVENAFAQVKRQDFL